MGDLIGRVDEKLKLPIERIRKQLKEIGIEPVSDRLATKIIADIMVELDYSFERKVKKNHKKIILKL